MQSVVSETQKCILSSTFSFLAALKEIYVEMPSPLSCQTIINSKNIVAAQYEDDVDERLRRG
jgi:hypothetical protein